MKDLISVIIPTYKNRGGLINSINSVLSQTYSNFEIIVVDDNDPQSESRLSTIKIMSQFKNNEKVKYIKHYKNLNGAVARNTGINSARGEFIAFLDDDDLFRPSKLDIQYKFLKGHPEFSAAYCWAAQGEKVFNTHYDGVLTKELLLLKTHMFTPTLIFRKDVLSKLGGFDETFRRHQDFELLLRFFKAGNKIGCVKNVLVDIGFNAGENIPIGKDLEKLKEHFFNAFNGIINDVDRTNPGFKEEVYVTHYVGVFLSHVKNNQIRKAIDIFCRYFPINKRVFITIMSVHFFVKMNNIIYGICRKYT